ncbi:ATP-dependent DNA helicase [Enterococcus sp. AZ103]|uniref:ATP-dependent DNA helicase n=1 Tax=Enterococcus sp. AZ103 TaxID=2774628 RepID=UPI003F225743
MTVKKIAVRKLVEFIMRTGSIDEGKNSQHTAQEGAKIHRSLQKQAGTGYEKEVWLKKQLTLADKTVQVEGRADGIITSETGITIDEIKTSETPFEDLTEGLVNLFFYQGMVYAYIYAEAQELSEINVQVRYFQTIEKKITTTTRKYSFDELISFFSDLMSRYEGWLVFETNWHQIRNQSLKELPFPFPQYRTGQRELAAAVYKTIYHQQQLFVEAPTGTGKTLSTLFPAFKALGEGVGERIFYLTAKTITRTVAEETIDKLAKKNGRVKSVTLTAKDKICFLSERNCTPEHCPFAAGYYDRVNDGLWDMLQEEDQFTRPVIEQYAKKHQLCPFELSLDVSLFCDVVIGDYNYLFDPVVHLQRFFEEENPNNIVLVDEAHNLVNRSKEMYSAEISREKIYTVGQATKKSFRKLRKAFNQVDNEFELIHQVLEEKNTNYHHQKAAAESLVNRLYSLQDLMKEWLAEHPEDDNQEKMLNLYFDILRFTRLSEFYDDHYETTVEKKQYDLIVKIYCIDPSLFLQQSMNLVGSTVLFSASFSPLPYYQEVLSENTESLTYRLPNPFPNENRLLLVHNNIQTTYQKRQQSLPEVVKSIEALVKVKKGNYLVFFPSFQYLDEVAEEFKRTFPEYNSLIQASQMSESEREQFLANFDGNNKETLVAFAVLGGIFSEGIDLTGDKLIGVVVVGVGLPQINHEQNLIKDYFDEKNNQGFSYAYQLPGINKVIQAAGRVIRQMNDRGVILLLDQRFNQASYQKLLPPSWYDRKIIHQTTEISIEVEKFWQKKLADTSASDN